MTERVPELVLVLSNQPLVGNNGTNRLSIGRSGRRHAQKAKDPSAPKHPATSAEHQSSAIETSALCTPTVRYGATRARPSQALRALPARSRASACPCRPGRAATQAPLSREQSCDAITNAVAHERGRRRWPPPLIGNEHDESQQNLLASDDCCRRWTILRPGPQLPARTNIFISQLALKALHPYSTALCASIYAVPLASLVTITKDLSSDAHDFYLHNCMQPARLKLGRQTQPPAITLMSTQVFEIHAMSLRHPFNHAIALCDNSGGL